MLYRHLLMRCVKTGVTCHWGDGVGGEDYDEGDGGTGFGGEV